MPTRINGIGTWYWGKNNIVTRNANCEFCSKYRKLTSYDTTLYFTFLFLPVIPIQRKRIIDQCAGCRRHRAIALAKWEQQKSDSLMQALQEWQGDRANAEKARKAIGICVAFQDRHAFEDLAPAVAQAFARDASVQMFLADGYDHFGQPQAAEDCYRAAMSIRNDAETRRALGAFLLKQLRPDEAKPLLQDILTTKDRAASPLLLGLAQAYQAVGNHDAAASLIDETGTAFPDLLSNPDFDRIRKTSAKYRGTSKRIKVPGLDPASRGGAREANWFQRNGAMTVIAMLIIIAAGAYLGVAASLERHAVYVVNGTTMPYVVMINSQQVHVPARSNIKITLGEGDYTVSVTDHPEIGTSTAKLHTSFWTRPFNRRVFVINPDRTAMLYERNVVYTASASTNATADRTMAVHIGQPLYDLKQPDDAFVEPPSSVDLPSSTSTVTRKLLAMFSKLSLESQVKLVHRQLDAQSAQEWMKRRAATSSDNMEQIELLGRLSLEAPPSEMIAFLKPHTADRPVRIDWHRMYQEMMEKQHPDYDLTGEYRALWKDNPGDPTLMYLTGRTLSDRAESRKMFQQAADGPSPCAYALYALAFEDLCQIQFESALERAERACSIDPMNVQFIWAKSQALEALQRFDAAAALAKAQQKHNGQYHGYVAEEVRLLVAAGNPSGAQKRIDEHCKELEQMHQDKQVIDAVRASLDATYAYARSDTPAFVAAMKQLNIPEVAWEVGLVKGDIASAEAALKEITGADLEQYALLAALAGAHGDSAIFDRAWGKIQGFLASGNKDERNLAKALGDANSAPSDAILQQWVSRPDQRCYLFTCLGERYPQQRQAFFAQAAKLNFTTGFPHREIAAALAKTN